MSTTKITRWMTFGLAAAAAVIFSTQAVAGSDGIDWKGKTVDWVIPFSESGGSAKWAHFYAPLLSEALPGQPALAKGWVVYFMWSLGIAIAGGTANIQRNVIAERGLGLPRDRAADAGK